MTRATTADLTRGRSRARRRYAGLDCHLILRTSRALADADPGLVGNLLVERMVGAHLHLARAWGPVPWAAPDSSTDARPARLNNWLLLLRALWPRGLLRGRLGPSRFGEPAAACRPSSPRAPGMAGARRPALKPRSRFHRMRCTGREPSSD